MQATSKMYRPVICFHLAVNFGSPLCQAGGGAESPAAAGAGKPAFSKKSANIKRTEAIWFRSVRMLPNYYLS